jgi:PIN domain nuclease of toxin-antitoxin system
VDTHIILWWLNEDEKLTPEHRNIISATDNICFISAASIWEISIKQKLGKLEIPADYLVEVKREGFQELLVSWNHCSQVSKLPLIHNDPFDRLLIAQSMLENLTLLSVDNKIKLYKVSVI